MALQLQTLVRSAFFCASFASLLLPSSVAQVSVDAEVQLNASDAGDGRRLGEAVSISGNTFVAGGTGAYTYELTTGGWVESFDLNTGLRSNTYGQAVAIDANTLVVTDRGAIDESLGAAAYVFERNGPSWELTATLPRGGMAPFHGFGSAVAISGDTVVVGAESDGNTSKTGRVWVFVRSGTIWNFQAVLEASDAGDADDFGCTVDISGDRVVVGAPGNDDAGDESGSAYVFDRTGTVWSQTEKLVAQDAAAGDEFGRTVSIDGSSALIGAPFAAQQNGAAYIFENQGGWQQTQKLNSNNGGGGELFGNSVAILGDRAVVAARRGNPDGLTSGAVFTFLRNGPNWLPEAQFSAQGAGPEEDFGGAVDLSPNAIVFGAPQESSVETWAGAAYVFAPLGCIQPADPFEPNDDCFSASPVAPGVVGPLTIVDGDDDWFSIDLPAGTMLHVDILFSNGNGNIDVETQNVCGVPDAVIVGNQDNEVIDAINNGAVDTTVNFRVFLASGVGCNEYVLDAQLLPLPPLCVGMDDALEDNDDCLSPVPIANGSQFNLIVADNDPDYYALTVPPFVDGRVALTFTHADGDVDLRILRQDCSQTVDQSLSGNDGELAFASNPTGVPIEFIVEVTLFGSGCNQYNMNVAFLPTSNPCAAMFPDDPLEPNDDCASALTVPPSVFPMLSVHDVNEDFYRISIPPNAQLDIGAFFSHAGGDIDVEVFSGDCLLPTGLANSASDNEFLSVPNPTPLPQDAVVRVFLFSGQCNGYDLDLQIQPLVQPCIGPDDIHEDNDDCLTAAVPQSNPSFGNFVELSDPDWYELFLPPMSTITVDVQFSHAAADVDLELLLGCGGPQVDVGVSVSDNESVSFQNVSFQPQDMRLQVFVFAGSAGQCANYDLFVGISQPGATNLSAFCFGDGSGADCPCGNNVPRNTGAGCANHTGTGCSLAAFGTPSASSDTLRIAAVGATPSSPGILISGDNALPSANPGSGLPIFDGLRCVGGNLARHGTRTSDANGDFGLTSPAWGPPDGPPQGLIAQGGFQVGQTRFFQLFYREDSGQGCQTGQNTSNGVTVTVEP